MLAGNPQLEAVVFAQSSTTADRGRQVQGIERTGFSQLLLCLADIKDPVPHDPGDHPKPLTRVVAPRRMQSNQVAAMNRSVRPGQLLRRTREVSPQCPHSFI